MRPDSPDLYGRAMNAAESFQIPLEAAESYEARFVPAIFAEWAPHIVAAAGVGPDDHVLDVCCGTGIVARTVADRLGERGRVIGLDLNEAMLTVAARVRPDLEWRQGDAHALPFDDHHFDAVTCQMALMFLTDRHRALAEMGRVVRPGGRVALVVPAALGDQPAYRPFVEIAARHAGPAARSLLATYWNTGDLTELVALVESAGMEVVEHRTRAGTARFASSDAFVTTEVEGSPLAARIDDPTAAAIRRDVARELAHYRTDRDTFEVPLLGHVIAARHREDGDR